MKRLHALTIVTLTVFAALTLVAQAAAQEQNNPKSTHYTVIDLGTLGGGFVQANVINNRGWVSGFATLQGDQSYHAFLWRNNVMTDLGTLGGPNSFVAYGLTNEGEMSGYSDASEPDPLGEDFCLDSTYLACQAFIWRKGVMSPLPSLGGNNSVAQGMNNRGQVVGQAENSSPDPTCQPPQYFQTPPVVWYNGRIHALPTFSGDLDGLAVAINDNGQIVGASGNCYTGPAGLAENGRHALLWQKGKMTYLGSLGGSVNNFPLAINNRGQIVGISNLSGDLTAHAFLWDNGSMFDLGTLPGDFSSYAQGINDTGQKVGQSCDSDFNCRAVLWEGNSITDLNTLLAHDSPLYLLAGLSINARGEIAGFAFDSISGERHGFLATPTEGETALADQSSPGLSKRAILPQEIREMLKQQRGRSGRGLMKRQ